MIPAQQALKCKKKLLSTIFVPILEKQPISTFSSMFKVIRLDDFGVWVQTRTRKGYDHKANKTVLEMKFRIY